MMLFRVYLKNNHENIKFELNLNNYEDIKVNKNFKEAKNIFIFEIIFFIYAETLFKKLRGRTMTATRMIARRDLDTKGSPLPVTS